MIYYVYLIEQANGRYCKIGVSNEPARRLTELQRHNPDRMYVRYLLEVRSQSDAYQLETHLHQVHSQRRRNGEWFTLSANQVVSVDNMTDTMRLLIVRIKEYPEWIIEVAPKAEPVETEPAQSVVVSRAEEMKWQFFFFAGGWFYSAFMFLLSFNAESGVLTIAAVFYLLLCILSVGGMWATLSIAWRLKHKTKWNNHNGHTPPGAVGAGPDEE